ncbi:MAG TPA: hypothetical protein VET51_06820 [Burkholderiales bacterium]|nr:hypothetical protein [Burkholderiales bacterium]
MKAAPAAWKTGQREQLYWLTDEQLARLAHLGTYPGADAAWERVRKIKEASHKSGVYYSQLNGFTVLDEDVPEEFKRSLSLSQRAKKFLGF